LAARVPNSGSVRLGVGLKALEKTYSSTLVVNVQGRAVKPMRSKQPTVNSDGAASIALKQSSTKRFPDTQRPRK
jgi:hypothetical protein